MLIPLRIGRLLLASLAFLFITLVSGDLRPNRIDQTLFQEAGLEHGFHHEVPRATTFLQKASPQDIARARKLVEAAVAESDRLNLARMNNPARNRYRLRPHTKISNKRSLRRRAADTDTDTHPPPLLQITPELSAAAALMAEVEAADINMTRSVPIARDDPYWMETVKRQGVAPFANDPKYKVFRNVKDYGAKGDGVTDDSDAFIKAMNDGKRCGEKCNGSSTKMAIVYVPEGTYMLAKTVPIPFGTQFIGNAKHWPTLKGPKLHLGLGLISTDQYTGSGKGEDGLDQEWYINTANFYRQIRNFKVDLTCIRDRESVSAIHYQVAQATSLQNIDITANPQNKAIFSENGSGGIISDITVHGGAYGFYGGNQQFTALRLAFDGCAVAVRVIWDWGWVWKSITVKNALVGFQLVPEDKNETKRQIIAGKQGSVGSASFLDSQFSNVNTAIMVKTINSDPGAGSTGIVISNTKVDKVSYMVTDASGKVLLQGSDVNPDSSWIIGPTYTADGKRSFVQAKKIDALWKKDKDTGLLTESNAYFERARPQYETTFGDTLESVRAYGAKGDGVSDDSDALQKAIVSTAAGGRPLFLDAGAYVITKTIRIPKSTVVIGEAWPQLMASGSYFGDASNPKPMIQVGDHTDERGSVELTDLIFTTKGAAPGAILVEWNLQADKRGAAALWDCHVRLGGATGSNLTPKECPPLTDGVNSKCQVAHTMMRIRTDSSGYFENMWLWAADHMIDDPALDDADNEMEQLSVYAARGLLVESTDATWLYGTAAEHAVLYQYNFYGAANLFASMIQTESPYYQPNPKPPAPFGSSIGYYYSDPKYSKDNSNDELSGSDASWALVMNKCKDITIFGAGLYSWFSTYSQDCIDQQQCQKVLAKFNDNFKGVTILHLITIGAKYMASLNGKGIAAKDNLNVKDHPAWSQVSMLEIPGGDGEPGDCDNSAECTDKLCDDGQDAYCEEGRCVCPGVQCGDDVVTECSVIQCGDGTDRNFFPACINNRCHCAHGIVIFTRTSAYPFQDTNVDVQYSNSLHPELKFEKDQSQAQGKDKFDFYSGDIHIHVFIKYGDHDDVYYTSNDLNFTSSSWDKSPPVDCDPDKGDCTSRDDGTTTWPLEWEGKKPGKQYHIDTPKYNTPNS